MGHPQVEKVSVKLGALQRRYKTESDNPNKMDQEQYRRLVASVKENGPLQDLLCRKVKGGYEVIDGHHRLDAYLEVYGPHHEMTVTVAPSLAALAKAKAASLGMNKIRGDVDYGIAADVLREIKDETDWTAEQMATLTGFSPEEIETLTSINLEEVDDALSEVAEVEAKEAPPDKLFVLEISFADKALYRLARRKLRKAAGKGGDLSTGLLAVLGESPEMADESS